MNPSVVDDPTEAKTEFAAPDLPVQAAPDDSIDVNMTDLPDEPAAPAVTAAAESISPAPPAGEIPDAALAPESQMEMDMEMLPAPVEAVAEPVVEVITEPAVEPTLRQKSLPAPFVTMDLNGQLDGQLDDQLDDQTVISGQVPVSDDLTVPGVVMAGGLAALSDEECLAPGPSPSRPVAPVFAAPSGAFAPSKATPVLLPVATARTPRIGIGTRLRAVSFGAQRIAGRRVELSALQLGLVLIGAVAGGGVLFGGRHSVPATPLAAPVVAASAPAAPQPVAAPIAVPMPVAGSPAASAPVASAPPADPGPQSHAVPHAVPHAVRVAGRGHARLGAGKKVAPKGTQIRATSGPSLAKGTTPKGRDQAWVDPFGQ